VSLAIILAVTVVLARLKLAQQGPQHLVFFYLAPTAFVAILYGSVLSLLCAIAATLIAAFFLYDPITAFTLPTRMRLASCSSSRLLACLELSPWRR
jgi:K+-sensing histidine kinase KdpD